MNDTPKFDNPNKPLPHENSYWDPANAESNYETNKFQNLRNDNTTDKYISTKPSDKYIEVITTNRKKIKRREKKKILICV